jgi:hypothetical protein
VFRAILPISFALLTPFTVHRSIANFVPTLIETKLIPRIMEFENMLTGGERAAEKAVDRLPKSKPAVLAEDKKEKEESVYRKATNPFGK